MAALLMHTMHMQYREIQSLEWEEACWIYDEAFRFLPQSDEVAPPEIMEENDEEEEVEVRDGSIFT